MKHADLKGAQPMTTPGRKSYLKPPVTEAIIDVTINKIEGFNSNQLKAIAIGDSGEFCELNELVNLEFNPSNTPQIKQESIGYIFQSQKDTSRISIRYNGFSSHKLKPYTSWEKHVEQFKLLWSQYRHGIKQPVTINRISVKYVNSIVLPLNEFTSETSFFPQASAQSLINYKEFYARKCVEYPDHTLAIVNAYLAGPTNLGNAALVFDIDVIKNAAVTEDAVFTELEALHRIENSIFENSLTEKLKSTFEPTYTEQP